MGTRLDGNVSGGILGEFFPFEMTGAIATCASCGTTGPVGTLVAYASNMGMVMRCPRCEAALVRLTRVKDRYWMDMRGMRVLQVSAAR